MKWPHNRTWSVIRAERKSSLRASVCKLAVPSCGLRWNRKSATCQPNCAALFSVTRAPLMNKKHSAGLTINRHCSSPTTMHHTSNTINIYATMWQKSVIYILCWETLFAFISVVYRDIQLAALARRFSTDVSNTLVALLHLCQAGWDPPLSCDE